MWEEQWGEINAYNLVTIEKYLDEMHHVRNDKCLKRKYHHFLPYLFKVSRNSQKNAIFAPRAGILTSSWLLQGRGQRLGRRNLRRGVQALLRVLGPETRRESTHMLHLTSKRKILFPTSGVKRAFPPRGLKKRTFPPRGSGKTHFSSPQAGKTHFSSPWVEKLPQFEFFSQHAIVTFSHIDNNDDGKITVDEFVSLGRDFFITEDEKRPSKHFWGPLVDWSRPSLCDKSTLPLRRLIGGGGRGLSLSSR